LSKTPATGKVFWLSSKLAKTPILQPFKEDLSIDTAFSQVRLVVKKKLFVKILNLGMCGPAMGGKYFTEA